MKPHRVSVVGPVNADLFVRGTVPRDYRELNEWVGPCDVDLVLAGSVGYTVQVLATLGCRVDVHTTVGDDAFGRHLLAELERAGLGTAHVRRAPGATAVAIYLLLFGGKKRPMTYRLCEFDPWPDEPALLDRDDGLPHLVHAGGLLHFHEKSHRGVADALAAARRAGVLTSADPQFPLLAVEPPWLPPIEGVLGNTDVLLADEGEAASIFAVDGTEHALAAAHELGCRIVAIKRGAEGSIVSDGTSIVVQPAVRIPDDRVREAIGAGDAYDAGLLVGLLEGRSLEGAARLATAAAACTLAGRGGAEAVRERAVVEEMLARVPPASVRRGP